MSLTNKILKETTHRKHIIYDFICIEFKMVKQINVMKARIAIVFGVVITGRHFEGGFLGAGNVLYLELGGG